MKTARTLTMLLCLAIAAGSRADDQPFEDSPAPVGLRQEQPPDQELFLLKLVRDPAEPGNRLSYRATGVVRKFALDPLARGYLWVLPRPARRSIDSLATNLRFPVRFVNDLLQLRPRTAGLELARFATNTTVGIAGLFDPAARLGLPVPEPEDFGQTFGYWGMDPGFFLFVPLLGPSSLRDGAGMIGDLVLDPASWVPFAGSFLQFNRFSLGLASLERLEDGEADPYAAIRDLWAVNRERAVRNFRVPVEDLDDRPVASLNAILLSQTVVAEPERLEVELNNGKRLPYAYWAGTTPRLVFVLPGLGGHRSNGLVRTLAKRLLEAGYSVAAISSPFHAEFVEHASSTSVPGYTPDDAADVGHVLRRIGDDLGASLGMQPWALVGASLGGLHTAFVAAADTLKLERFVAINPPVDTLYALRQLDGYYASAYEWSDAGRRKHIAEVLLKAAAVATRDADLQRALPFDTRESKFLIGTNFRRALRDGVFASQQSRNLRVLRRSWTDLHREPVYREIAAFSFEEYMHHFVLPFESGNPQGASTAERIERSGLRWLEARLRQQTRLRVISNEDDFLLRDGDLEWLQATLGERLVVHATGGHLGNLVDPTVLDSIIRALEP